MACLEKIFRFENFRRKSKKKSQQSSKFSQEIFFCIEKIRRYRWPQKTVGSFFKNNFSQRRHVQRSVIFDIFFNKRTTLSAILRIP